MRIFYLCVIFVYLESNKQNDLVLCIEVALFFLFFFSFFELQVEVWLDFLKYKKNILTCKRTCFHQTRIWLSSTSSKYFFPLNIRYPYGIITSFKFILKNLILTVFYWRISYHSLNFCLLDFISCDFFFFFFGLY